MEEKTPETKPQKEKTKNNKALLIGILVVLILILLVGGAFATIYIMRTNKTEEIIETEETNKENEEEGKEKEQEKEEKKEAKKEEVVKVKVLSEALLKPGVYELKDEEYYSKNEKGNVVFMKEGVFEIQLTKGSYGRITIDDVMGQVKLSGGLFEKNSKHGQNKITEVYIYPGMYLKIDKEDIPDGVKASTNIEVALRRLDKKLDLDTKKVGAITELVQEDDDKFYLVGKDIVPGNYDVDLVKSDAVRLYVENKSGKTKMLISMYSDERLFQDLSLAKDDKVYLLTAIGSPLTSPVKAKIDLIAEK